MNFSRIFIERPVMTTLVTLAVLLFGAIAFLIAGLLTPKSGDHPAQPVVELG